MQNTNIPFNQDMCDSCLFKRKVLVIDDDEILLGIIVEKLRYKFNVYTAKNLKEATIQLIHNNFDCIILDIHLGKDGLTLNKIHNGVLELTDDNGELNIPQKYYHDGKIIVISSDEHYRDSLYDKNINFVNKMNLNHLNFLI